MENLLAKKAFIFIQSSLKTITGPGIAFLSMAFFYIVNHVKKYKNKISKVPIKDINLLV